MSVVYISRFPVVNYESSSKGLRLREIYVHRYVRDSSVI